MHRMGGGKNWLGCHFLALLALHEHFVQERRSVPGFLILDQPTQVYFPSTQQYKALSGTTEDTLESEPIWMPLEGCSICYFRSAPL